MKYFLILTLIIPLNILAQNLPSSGAVAPEGNDGKSSSANDLISVDPFTGIGNITIPIYHFELDGLDLGIKLRYDTKGIRVDEMASNVGLGWDLEYGGSINRQCHGIEDEVSVYTEINSNRTYIALGNWVYRQGSSVGEPMTAETSRDRFSANIAGRNVEFTMGLYDVELNSWLSTMYSSPKSNLKIKLTESQVNTTAATPISGVRMVFGLEKNNFLEIAIEDENRNVFYFTRGKYQSQEISGHSYWSTHSWVLTKIVTQTGKEVKYTYEEAEVHYPDYLSQEVKEKCSAQPPIEIMKNEIIRFHGYEKRLKSIEYPNGTVVSFSYRGNIFYMNDPGVIESIKVESRYDDVVKNNVTFVLNHALAKANTPGLIPYWDHSNLASSCWSTGPVGFCLMEIRTILTGISRVGNDGTTSENFYSFEYDPMPLPVRFCKLPQN